MLLQLSFLKSDTAFAGGHCFTLISMIATFVAGMLELTAGSVENRI